MMSLALMRALLESVDETGTSPIATDLAQPWVPDAAVTFFRASANCLFVFQHAGQPYVLRITDAARRTSTAIGAEIALLRHLDAAGVPIAAPQPTADGADLITRSTPVGLLHVAAFARVGGTHLDAAELAPEQLQGWGRALGQLHAAASSFRQPGRPGWQVLLAEVEQSLGADEPHAQQALALVRRQLAQLPADERSFGLIHGDFELDNLLWDGQRFVAIDFDEAAYSWFAADIAAAVRDLFGDRADLVDAANPALQQLIAGYRTAHPLADADLDHLPVFMLMQHLLLFGAVKRALAWPAEPDGPLWGAALHERLAATLARYRAEFAAFSQ